MIVSKLIFVLVSCMDTEKPSLEAPDPQKMYKRLQRMHFMAQELQAKMEDMEVEGDSGDGLIKVVMNCTGKLVSVDMHKSLKDWDREILENLLLTALNSAVEAKETLVTQEMQRMTKERMLDDDKFE